MTIFKQEPYVHPKTFDSYEDCLKYFSVNHSISLSEVKRALKRLKKLRLLTYSTKSKNRFVIKMNGHELGSFCPETYCDLQYFKVS